MRIELEIDRWLFTKPGQLCDAPLVAEVVVATHEVARWNTVDGKRPPIASAEEIMKQRYFIYAPVTFMSITPLRAHGPALTGAAFMTLGGQVGQDSYRFGDMPQLPDIGGRYIVVLAPPSSSKGLTPADTLLVSYTYPVDASGIVTLQQAGDPNEPGVGPVQPEITVALTDLKATLAKCAARRITRSDGFAVVKTPRAHAPQT